MSTFRALLENNQDLPEFVANVKAFIQLRESGAFKGYEDMYVLVADQELKSVFRTKDEAENEIVAKKYKFAYADIPDDTKIPIVKIR